jgi:hypothetical protein
VSTRIIRSRRRKFISAGEPGECIFHHHLLIGFSVIAVNEIVDAQHYNLGPIALEDRVDGCEGLAIGRFATLSLWARINGQAGSRNYVAMFTETLVLQLRYITSYTYVLYDRGSGTLEDISLCRCDDCC